MSLNLHIGASGKLQLFAARDTENGRVVRALTPVFDNIVTDAGLDRLGSSTGAFSYCHVGSGGATPAPSDTTLQAWVASTSTKYQGDTTDGSTVAEMQSADVIWGSFTQYFQFGMGAVVGNIAEVALSSGSSASSVVTTRALIRDNEGNPVVINMAADEYLYIAYTITCTINAKDVVGSFELGGVTYETVSGVYNCTSSYGGADLIGKFIRGGGGSTGSTSAQRGGMRVVTSAVTRTSPGPSSTSTVSGVTVSQASYVSGSFKRDTTFVAAPAGGNVRWRTILMDVGFMSFRIDVNTNLTKTSDYTLSLTVSQTWGRGP